MTFQEFLPSCPSKGRYSICPRSDRHAPNKGAIINPAPAEKKNKAAYPEHVNAPVQYGSGVETIVGYLHARQYLPYNRLKELLKDCYGIPLSEGSIDNMIHRFAQKAAPIYQMHKRRFPTVR